MLTTIKVLFDGRVFVPQSHVELPAGTELDVSFERPATTLSSAPTPLADLAQALSQLPSDPDWPADGAQQVDHYLYGTPKRP